MQPVPDHVRYFSPQQLAAAAGRFSREELDTLERINTKVAAGESLAAVMDLLFDETQALMPCDRISVGFLEDQGRRVVCRYVRTSYEPVLMREDFAGDLAASSLRPVMQSGTPRVMDDLPAYLAAHPASGSTRLLVAEGVRSSMTCALTVEGRPVGLLWRSSRRANAYGPREVRLHMAVVERLSQAVEKAYRIEQLEAANRAYAEMLGFVSHELRNPVASIISQGQLLLDGYAGRLSEAQARDVSAMLAKGQYLLDLIRDYLDLSRVEGGKLKLDARRGVDLAAEVIRPAEELLAVQVVQREMKLESRIPADLPAAECDPALLQIVVVNLLGNAAKYGRPGGRIELAAEAEPGRFRVSVFNEGPGFPPGQRGRLFRRFSRLDTPELRRQKGSGVGLYVCWQIVQLHGGRIWAESEEGRWARFTFEIPQPLPGVDGFSDAAVSDAFSRFGEKVSDTFSDAAPENPATPPPRT